MLPSHDVYHPQYHWSGQYSAALPIRTRASQERDLCLGGDSGTTTAVASSRKWNHRRATPQYLQLSALDFVKNISLEDATVGNMEAKTDTGVVLKAMRQPMASYILSEETKVLRIVLPTYAPG
jgi:hypothetical protein